MTRRHILAYGLAATLAATALAAVSPAIFAFLDLRVYDAMLAAATSHPPSDRVAIATIDDRSLEEVGQWPWPRDVVARLIDGIRGLGARVVAIDMLFAEPDRFGRAEAAGTPTGDSTLIASLSEGRAVLSYALTFDAAARLDPGCVLHPVMPVLVDGPDGHSPVDQLFHATAAVCSLPDFSRSSGASGYLNASPDRDGVLRRIPVLMEFRGGIYPSLALAAVMKANGARRLVLSGLAGERARLTLDDTPIPLDGRGTLLIRFRDPSATYQRIAATDILNKRVPPGALRDRIVFVGTTAIGVQDVVMTPLGVATPGIEVHARAADTLLQGDFVVTPPSWRAYELGATMALTASVTLVVAVFGFLSGVLAAAGLIVVLWWGTFVGLNSGGVFLSPVFPTVGLLLVLSVLTAVRVRHERRLADAERTRRERAHQFVIQSLTSLTEARDAATGRHARRTQAYARLLAGRLATLPRFREQLPPERVELISTLAPLHDIGKVGVRDAVLNKPGALSDDELDEIRRHPALGHDTITQAERRSGAQGDEVLLQLAKDIVYTHHERWDGRGYPRGLTGDAIPVAGRIVALVDVYDALSNSRTYRPSLTHEQAVASIVAGRGTHFDPDIVDVFVAVSEEFRRLAQSLTPEGEAARH